MQLSRTLSALLPLRICFAKQIESTRNKSNNQKNLYSTATSNNGNDLEMTTTTEEDSSSIWTYQNPEGFASLDHPGYSFESDPQTYLGGWLAHRRALEPSIAGAGANNDSKNDNQNVSGTTETATTTTEITDLVKQEEKDWIQEHVAPYITRYEYAEMPIARPPRILVLYGSLRETSFSRKLAYEFARLLEMCLGCDVRVYNPRGLPVRDPALENHPKVQEIRALTQWSDGHVWVSPEMHGTITGVFKNQIDWIPLNTGSVRPTQGKTCLVAQVNGGSQSFNAINALRLLARWMRMPCCTNQSSVAKAWNEFNGDDRMKDSSFRDRVVDCAEEFAKFTVLIRGPARADELTDRCV